MKQFYQYLLFALLGFYFSSQALANQPELLRPEQAFQVQVEANDADSLLVTLDIASGYYLYRDKFQFTSNTPAIEIPPSELPSGERKHDPEFGEVQIFRNHQTFIIPLNRSGNTAATLDLSYAYQGCADIGICYPPQKKNIQISLSGQAEPSRNTGSVGFSSLNKALNGFRQNLFGQDELLPAEQAFRFTAREVDGKGIHVTWNIAEGYYLYRDKLALSIARPSDIILGSLDLPPGLTKEDAEFGTVQVYYDDIEADVGISGKAGSRPITLIAKFQGCADRGVCYPPMEQRVQLEVDGRWRWPASSAPLVSEQDQIADNLKNSSLWFSMLSFFGFGLLLAFTPCVFPMIPILSGIIVGQGKRLNTRRALLLSITYVLASALVYTVFGLLAGLYGANLQTFFQHPAILTSFSLVFVLLSLSMFGFYDLQLPSVLQSRLASLGSEKAGSIAGAAIMGAFSALIVGPCVAAPLAGALIFIGQTGDALLGGAALFAMGLGMGFPLVMLGTSAGKLLPATGPWMEQVKSIFGFILLGVAIWLMSRVLPGQLTLLLWALLVIISAIFMGAVSPLPARASGWQKCTKGLGLALLAYGLALVLGVAAGNHDPLKPLAQLNSQPQNSSVGLAFRRIASLAELEQQLELARQNNQAVMLDFYADWCVSCIEMEHQTFTDAQVQAALREVLLLQVDVTANNGDDQALLRQFALIGPPAILFFDSEKREQKNARIIGFLEAEDFVNHLNQVYTP